MDKKTLKDGLMIAIMFVSLFTVGIIPFCSEGEDIWLHLKVGKDIVNNHSIPHHDIYSHTAQGKEWIAHEWLAEVIFYVIYNSSGWTGLVLLRAFIITIIGGLLWIILRRWKVNIYLRGAIIIGTISGILLFAYIRPHLFSWIFIILTIYLLDIYRVRQRMKYLWILLILLIVWANIHGSYLIGIGLIFIYALSELLKHFLVQRKTCQSENISTKRIFFSLFLMGLMGIVAIGLLNPNHFKLLVFPLKLMGWEWITANIVEWFPFHKTENLYPLFIIETCICGIILLCSLKKVELQDVLIFIIVLVMVLSAVRHIPIATLFIGLIMGKYLAIKLKNGILRRNWIKDGVFIFTFAFLFMLWLPRINHRTFSPTYTKSPYGAVKFLKEHKIKGNLYNNYAWGGFIMWNAYPDLKVFIDGRIDVYGEKIGNDYVKIGWGLNWAKMLENYGVTIILVSSYKVPNSINFGQDKNWRLIYFDKESQVYVKNIPRYHSIIDKFGYKRNNPRSKNALYQGNGHYYL